MGSTRKGLKCSAGSKPQMAMGNTEGLSIKCRRWGVAVLSTWNSGGGGSSRVQGYHLLHSEFKPSLG